MLADSSLPPPFRRAPPNRIIGRRFRSEAENLIQTGLDPANVLGGTRIVRGAVDPVNCEASLTTGSGDDAVSLDILRTPGVEVLGLEYFIEGPRAFARMRKPDWKGR